MKTLAARAGAPVGGLDGQRPRWVVGWAWLGGLFLAVEAWAIIGWLWSGDATPTPRGLTPVPDWMLISIRAIEFALGFGMLVVLWIFVIRPWRRHRSVSRDGWLCLVFCSMAWQDSLLNYFQHWFAYNTVLFNFGSWDSHVIGWMSPHGNLIASPLIFYGGYGSVVFAGVVLGNAFVRRIVTRRPSLTCAKIVGVTFGFYAVFGLIEIVFLRAGVYAYPGAIEELTLFHGHYYQYPVYEWLAFVSLMTAWACMRYFRDDRGETLAERGIDQIGGSERRRTCVRVLAFAGLGNFIFVVVYSGPMAIAGLYSDPWPTDVTKRSYLTSGLCGPGTDYACAGPSVPIPRRGSSHIRPDGTLAPATSSEPGQQ